MDLHPFSGFEVDPPRDHYHHQDLGRLIPRIYVHCHTIGQIIEGPTSFVYGYVTTYRECRAICEHTYGEEIFSTPKFCCRISIPQCTDLKLFLLIILSNILKFHLSQLYFPDVFQEIIFPNFPGVARLIITCTKTWQFLVQNPSNKLISLILIVKIWLIWSPFIVNCTKILRLEWYPIPVHIWACFMGEYSHLNHTWARGRP